MINDNENITDENWSEKASRVKSAGTREHKKLMDVILAVSTLINE